MPHCTHHALICGSAGGEAPHRRIRPFTSCSYDHQLCMRVFVHRAASRVSFDLRACTCTHHSILARARRHAVLMPRKEAGASSVTSIPRCNLTSGHRLHHPRPKSARYADAVHCRKTFDVGVTSGLLHSQSSGSCHCAGSSCTVALRPTFDRFVDLRVTCGRELGS